MKIKLILLVLSAGMLTACSSNHNDLVNRRLDDLEELMTKVANSIETQQVRQATYIVRLEKLDIETTTNAVNSAELAGKLLEVATNLLTLQTKVSQLEADHTALKTQMLVAVTNCQTEIVQRRLATLEADHAGRLAALEATTNTTQTIQRLIALQNRLETLQTSAATPTAKVDQLANKLEAATGNLQQKIQTLEADQTAARDSIIQRLAALERATNVIVVQTNPPAISPAAERWLFKN